MKHFALRSAFFVARRPGLGWQPCGVGCWVPCCAGLAGRALLGRGGILYIDDSRQGCTLSGKICMACQIWHVLYVLRVWVQESYAISFFCSIGCGILAWFAKFESKGAVLAITNYNTIRWNLELGHKLYTYIYFDACFLHFWNSFFKLVCSNLHPILSFLGIA